MKTRLNKEVKEIFNAYIQEYPEEKSALKHLEEHIRKQKDYVSRSNLLGHVTTSALVLNDQNQILLIFHNKRKRFLQPGGHVENDTSLIESAIREVLEETNISANPHPKMLRKKLNNFIPIHIDSHRIPENVEKGEPEHWHHDYMFLLNAENNSIQLDLNEVSEFAWVSLDEKIEDIGLQSAIDKLKMMKSLLQ